MNIKNKSGFTAIELIAIMVVMGIISAFVIGRATDNEPELIAQKEVLKVQLRYAQSRAMNSTSNYGIETDGNIYWLFRYNVTSGDVRVNFPGESANHIDLSAIGLSLSMEDGNIVSFDSEGIPYLAYSGTQQTLDRTLTLSSGTDTESIIITKNTGFIQ